MSHYLARELRRHLGQCPPYAFWFEFSERGRLHLHGVIVMDSDGRQQALLRKALCAAGGSLRGRSRIIQYTQSRLEPLWDGLGWYGYSQKAYQDTMFLLGTNKISFVSSSLKRMCRDAPAAGAE